MKLCENGFIHRNRARFCALFHHGTKICLRDNRLTAPAFFPSSGLSHSILQYFKANGKLSHTRRPSRPIIIDIWGHSIYIIIKVTVLLEVSQNIYDFGMSREPGCVLAYSRIFGGAGGSYCHKLRASIKDGQLMLL